MKLTYRGISYETNNDQTSVPVVNLRDRNARNRLNQEARAENLNAILIYRGNAYNVQPTASTVANTSTPSTNSSVEERARLLTLNHHRSVKNRQQSLLRRSASEAGLGANIANFWNHIQGGVHPSFGINYDRSHATLS
jgi:hypothetical protein